jgi:hypothetical protein
MGNVHKFTQHYRQIAGDMSVQLGAETSDYIQTPTFANMENYDLIIGVGQVSNCSSGSAVTLQMYEATDATGGGAQAVTGATDVYTSAALAACDVLIAQVRGEDLSAGYQYVGARLTAGQADGTEIASVWLLEGRARYKQATLPA